MMDPLLEDAIRNLQKHNKRDGGQLSEDIEGLVLASKNAVTSEAAICAEQVNIARRGVVLDAQDPDRRMVSYKAFARLLERLAEKISARGWDSETQFSYLKEMQAKSIAAAVAAEREACAKLAEGWPPAKEMVGPFFVTGPRSFLLMAADIAARIRARGGA